MVSDTTVDTARKKRVSMKTTGHEKSRTTVAMAAKGHGTKLKPFIVFKEDKHDVEKLKKEYGNKCILASSTSGWTNTGLTLSWTNAVISQFSFTRQLFGWDTYECHLMPIVQRLKRLTLF